MKVMYAGRKEIKGDNVAQTGKVWTPGQVHDIEDDVKAAKLIAHSTIWKDVTGKSDAERAQMMTPEIKVVSAEPRIHVMPEGDNPFWDPYVVVVPEEVFKKVQDRSLTVVFMTPADVDAFSDWKLDQATKPDTAPKLTGPTPQSKETKPGIDSKAGLEAKAKKAA